MNSVTMKYLLFLPLCCLLLTVCIVSGCATTQDVDVLRADINRLLKESYAAKSDIESLKEKTTGVAKEESFQVVRMSQAEIQSQLATLAGDIQKLNGRFDENKFYLDKSLKDSTSEIELLKTQMTALEKQIGEIANRVNMIEDHAGQQAEPLDRGQAKETERRREESSKEVQPADVKTAKQTSPGDSAQQYDEAYSAFKNMHYREAREKFEGFIKAFPGDELSDNAHFWIAETYYQEKDFEDAILAYETLLKKYPKSQKAPGALLKQGYSFIELGDKKTGTVILEQLIERYPKTKEADLGKKQIEKIKKTTAKKRK
jgi:tol-pal system protein YbgF